MAKKLSEAKNWMKEKTIKFLKKKQGNEEIYSVILFLPCFDLTANKTKKKTTRRCSTIKKFFILLFPL